MRRLVFRDLLRIFKVGQLHLVSRQKDIPSADVSMDPTETVKGMKGWQRRGLSIDSRSGAQN